LRISIPQAFAQAGADAVAGCLIAHFARLRTGRGQHVDVSAQTSIGIATLGQILAHSVGDANPSWERKAPGADHSGSGAGTPADQKKWACLDGLAEFHLSVGPASGGFTNNFFRWMADEGVISGPLTEVDWRTLPERLKDGSFSPADFEAARTATRAFLATKTQREVLRAATDRKITCVPIYDTAAVAASDQLAARQFWVEVGGGERRRRMPGRFAAVKGGDPALVFARPAPLLGEHDAAVTGEWSAERSGPALTSTRDDTAALPLSGLVVLDLSWVLAGPVIARALADFGATVIRVETSTRPETSRLMPPYYEGVKSTESSALFGTCNAGKLGLTIDLKREAGRALVREIAQQVDVVIEAFSPGTMARWGLDYATLSADHHDLIMLSTSIMGQSGPYSSLAGYGNVGAALSGFQDIVGWPDRPPFGPFGPYTDFLGPRLSLVTLLAALDRRRTTGVGCYIDVAQSEAGVYFQGPELAQYFADGVITHRLGNRDRAFAPHGVYRCADADGEPRFVAIAVCTDDQWAALAGIVDVTAAGVTWGSAVSDRHDHHNEIDVVIEAFTLVRTAAEVERILQAVGVPSHVVASSRDIAHDPQIAHRGHLVTLPHHRFGTVVVEGPRYLLSDTPGVVARPAPMFHQDNHMVLVDLLGFDEARYEQLTGEGVLR
jgi:crotonobetainyl-CoA:carnitine CoA-transferase CaiB-like acyl-CoA transferase